MRPSPLMLFLIAAVAVIAVAQPAAANIDPNALQKTIMDVVRPIAQLVSLISLLVAGVMAIASDGGFSPLVQKVVQWALGIFFFLSIQDIVNFMWK